MTKLITIAGVTTGVLTYSGLKVCTTKQLAEFYGCAEESLRKNFNNHKDKFEEGKHYFRLTGTQVSDFAGLYTTFTTHANATVLMLWTEKGAARHAKMLTTDKAWDVFEKMEDAYFRVQEATYSGISQDSNKVLAANLEAFALFKYPEHIAQIEAVERTLKLTGVDYKPLMLNSPVQCNIPKTEVYLAPTELGIEFGYSAITVNKMLRDAGLQVKGALEWDLTPAGLLCGYRKSWHGLNTTKKGYHNHWCVSKVAHIFTKALS